MKQDSIRKQKLFFTVIKRLWREETKNTKQIKMRRTKKWWEENHEYMGRILWRTAKR